MVTAVKNSKQRPERFFKLITAQSDYIKAFYTEHQVMTSWN